MNKTLLANQYFFSILEITWYYSIHVIYDFNPPVIFFHLSINGTKLEACF